MVMHSPGPDKFGLYNIRFWPRDKEQGIGHRATMTDAGPTLSTCLKRSFLAMMSMLPGFHVKTLTKYPMYSSLLPVGAPGNA